MRTYNTGPSMLCVLYCTGVRQVCETHTGDGARRNAGTQEIPMAEIPVCVDDYDWCGDVYVQAFQGSGSNRDIGCVWLG